MKIKMISREYNSLKIVLNYFARENFATYKAVLKKNKVMRKQNLHCEQSKDNLHQFCIKLLYKHVMIS